MKIVFLILVINSIYSKLSSYEEDDDGHLVDITVTRLTDDNFQRLTQIHLPFKPQTNDKPFPSDWFIIYYSPTCPHCKKALPQWNEFSKSIISGRKTTKRKMKIGAIDCKHNTALCDKFNIEQYPTLLYLQKDYQKHQFLGQRTYDDFFHYINQQSLDVQQQYMGSESMKSSWSNFFNQFTRISILIMAILLTLICMLVYAIIQPSDLSVKLKQFSYNDQFDGQQSQNLKTKW